MVQNTKPWLTCPEVDFPFFPFPFNLSNDDDEVSTAAVVIFRVALVRNLTPPVKRFTSALFPRLHHSEPSAIPFANSTWSWSYFQKKNPVWLISLRLSFPTVKSNEILGVFRLLMSQNIKYQIINVFWKNKLITSNGPWSSNSQSEKKLFSGTGRKTIHYRTTGSGLLINHLPCCKNQFKGALCNIDG